jgi:5-methylcytosine-specific restriction enzyme A
LRYPTFYVRFQLHIKALSAQYAAYRRVRRPDSLLVESIYMTEMLRPFKKQNLIELVAAAGMDVSDWGNFKGGQEKASTNPKFCYEWSFVQEGQFVLINIWYENMLEEAGKHFQVLNFRKFASDLIGVAGSGVRRARAKKFDEALRLALVERLPLKVIILDRKNTSIPTVGFRLLDPMLWAVKTYSQHDGECRIERGLTPYLFEDQFSSSDKDDLVDRSGPVVSNPYPRSSEMRHKVLQRARGKCEFCGVEGFLSENGRLYLETHHIVPLSERGLDKVKNMAALCPNHHREAHFGQRSKLIRTTLQEKFGRKA